MPQSKKPKHSAKKGRPESAKTPKTQEQVRDYYKFFTDGRLLQSQYLFPSRDELASIFLRNKYKSANHQSELKTREQEKECHAVLATKFLWLQLNYWCPGAAIADEEGSREVLHLINLDVRYSLSIGKLAQGLRKSANGSCFHGADVRIYPGNIKLLLKQFEARHKLPTADILVYSTKTILRLEGILITCLSIPRLRPLVLPIAEARLIHVVSKMLDYLLGLDSLETAIPEIDHVDTSTELESRQPTVVETIHICAKLILTFFSRITSSLLAHFNDTSTGTLTSIRMIDTKVKYFAAMFRILLGSGQCTPEMDVEFQNFCHGLRKVDETLASSCLWMYTKRRENGASPLWGNLQDDNHFEQYLHRSPSVCDCLVTPAKSTCQRCLSRFLSVLDSFLDRLTYYDSILKDTAHVLEEMIKAFQRNTTSGLSVHDECCRYQGTMESIKTTIDNLLDIYLISHLIRMARLTSNFTRTIESSDASALLTSVLCKSICRLFAMRTATKPFAENVKKGTASALLQNTTLNAIKDDIMLLSTIAGYIRHEKSVVVQQLDKEAREADTDENRESSPAPAAMIAEVKDEMLSKTETD